MVERMAFGRRAPSGSAWATAKPLYLAALLAILTYFGVRLLISLRDILIMLFVSLVLAAALSRPTAALQRRGLPLGLAVGLVQVVGLAVVLVVAWFVVPRLSTSWPAFPTACPATSIASRDFGATTRASELATPSWGRSTRRLRNWPTGLGARPGSGWSTFRSGRRSSCSSC
jgi:predicted PurR-regulated permease PerM